jgi:hypothetical protein
MVETSARSCRDRYGVRHPYSRCREELWKLLRSRQTASGVDSQQGELKVRKAEQVATLASSIMASLPYPSISKPRWFCSS